jgi:hypothetical protein
MIKEWLGLHNVNTQEWTGNLSIKAWQTKMSCKCPPNRKAVASLTELVSWKVSKESNARVFRNKSTMPSNLHDIDH